MSDWIEHALRTMSWSAAWGLFLAENVALFAMACVGGTWLERRLNFSGAVRTRQDAGAEVALGVSSIVLNTVVTLVGLALWRVGWVVVRPSTAFHTLWDFVVLVLVMDTCMYWLHRLAHQVRLYPWFHRTHHRFETTRPLTLFAIHPLEVAAFGTLWIVVLAALSPCWLGMSLYLAFNLASGTFGHLGVEVLPAWWIDHPVLQWIATPTFHQMHHRQPDTNMGFYTVLWDRACTTLAPDYRTRFTELARKSS